MGLKCLNIIDYTGKIDADAKKLVERCVLHFLLQFGLCFSANAMYKISQIVYFSFYAVFEVGNLSFGRVRNIACFGLLDDNGWKNKIQDGNLRVSSCYGYRPLSTL